MNLWSTDLAIDTEICGTHGGRGRLALARKMPRLLLHGRSADKDVPSRVSRQWIRDAVRNSAAQKTIITKCLEVGRHARHLGGALRLLFKTLHLL